MSSKCDTWFRIKAQKLLISFTLFSSGGGKCGILSMFPMESRGVGVPAYQKAVVTQALNFSGQISECFVPCGLSISSVPYLKTNAPPIWKVIQGFCLFR